MKNLILNTKQIFKIALKNLEFCTMILLYYKLNLQKCIIKWIFNLITIGT